MISHDEEENVLSASDKEMDIRAREAVKAAINKAKICKNPVAYYDKEKSRLIPTHLYFLKDLCYNASLDYSYQKI